jgi:hypothetical protein
MRRCSGVAGHLAWGQGRAACWPGRRAARRSGPGGSACCMLDAGAAAPCPWPALPSLSWRAGGGLEGTGRAPGAGGAVQPAPCALQVRASGRQSVKQPVTTRSNKVKGEVSLALVFTAVSDWKRNRGSAAAVRWCTMRAAEGTLLCSAVVSRASASGVLERGIGESQLCGQLRQPLQQAAMVRAARLYGAARPRSSAARAACARIALWPGVGVGGCCVALALRSDPIRAWVLFGLLLPHAVSRHRRVAAGPGLIGPHPAHPPAATRAASARRLPAAAPGRLPRWLPASAARCVPSCRWGAVCSSQEHRIRQRSRSKPRLSHQPSHPGSASPGTSVAGYPPQAPYGAPPAPYPPAAAPYPPAAAPYPPAGVCRVPGTH